MGCLSMGGWGRRGRRGRRDGAFGWEERLVQMEGSVCDLTSLCMVRSTVLSIYVSPCTVHSNINLPKPCPDIIPSPPHLLLRKIHNTQPQPHPAPKTPITLLYKATKHPCQPARLPFHPFFPDSRTKTIPPPLLCMRNPRT